MQTVMAENLPLYCSCCYHQGHGEVQCHVKHPELKQGAADRMVKFVSRQKRREPEIAASAVAEDGAGVDGAGVGADGVEEGAGDGAGGVGAVGHTPVVEAELQSKVIAAAGMAGASADVAGAEEGTADDVGAGLGGVRVVGLGGGVVPEVAATFDAVAADSVAAQAVEGPVHATLTTAKLAPTSGDIVVAERQLEGPVVNAAIPQSPGFDTLCNAQPQSVSIPADLSTGDPPALVDFAGDIAQTYSEVAPVDTLNLSPRGAAGRKEEQGDVRQVGVQTRRTAGRLLSSASLPPRY